MFDPTSAVAEFMESEALDLPVSLTSEQRSEVHRLAQHFGLQHISRDGDSGRYLTLAKPGAIIGEPTFRRLIASELVDQGQASRIIPASQNVEEELASDPLPVADSYEGEKGPKRRGRRNVPQVVKTYNTRSKKNLYNLLWLFFVIFSLGFYFNINYKLARHKTIAFISFISI